MQTSARFQQILGVRFAVDGQQKEIDRVCRNGGLVVMPSGPALMRLVSDGKYREALLDADLVLPDSTLMVLVWRLVGRGPISKLSGLRYLRGVLERWEIRQGSSYWVMPSAESARRNAEWLNGNGIRVAQESLYVAPIYGAVVEDDELLREVELHRPRHVMLGLAGGTQEQLGLYLKKNLSYRPLIHCIGAAIAFLSGDQVRIPVWVDRVGLGWLWRVASNPTVYLPRYWAARRLVFTLVRFKDRLPCVHEDAEMEARTSTRRASLSSEQVEDTAG